MRMFPAVPIISRLIENPITLEPDFSLPAGTVVLLPIVALHRVRPSSPSNSPHLGVPVTFHDRSGFCARRL